MAQQSLFKNFSTPPEEIMRVAKEKKATIISYALPQEPEPEPEPRNKPPDIAPLSPEDLYFVVKQNSLYAGCAGAMMRKERIQGRITYWVYLPVFGTLFFHPEELRETALQEYLNQFNQWKTKHTLQNSNRSTTS